MATNGNAMGKPTEPKPQYLLSLPPPLFLLLGRDFLSSEKEKNKKLKKKSGRSWVLRIVVLTFAISVAMNALSASVMEQMAPFWMYLVLICIVFIGILFDVIGVAVTAASEAPFHAMAAKKKASAKIAISLLKSADRVSNFCNDVIGDICGIVSGTAVSAIVFTIPTNHFLWNLFFGALTAAVTVGGKALGKTFAMNKSETIILHVSELLCFFKKLLHIKV